MQFLSLEPFIPSGEDFEASKQLFLALDFAMNWDAGDYIGFEKDGCKFILQRYNNQVFAENLMLTIKVSDANAFYQSVIEKRLLEKFNIKISAPKQQPYGKEVNLIDIAGVCWHFVE